ncbi:MAG TPA: pyrroloquinoline quinone biosynthesis peptide chaperone PqqD [Acetobacteraceae bacterium]|jgi:pyrroloquinoline quinone biosynthesis protein D|nr:pyrroloquinoline quinone biosynthesis peptide chaperone PqqD [Acetobacteraceae bacterium]
MSAPLTESSRPGLSPHTRMKNDAARGGWVLLAPERVLMLDPIAAEILTLCDGITEIGAIAEELARRHAAPREEVLVDVIEMLQGLRDKGLIIA